MPHKRDLRAAARTSIPPALAVEVPRRRVESMLDDATGRPLTIVTAGAGWGKTTVVASWVRRRARRDGTDVAWLNLSPVDDDPALFWDSLLRTVVASGAVPAGHPLALLSTDGGVTDEVLGAVFKGLDTLPEPLLVILDDFQVIRSDAVMAALTELVSLRTNVRLLLLTRFDPPLPLHRLRLDGALAEVSAADLAFDVDDVRMLAAGAETLDLSDVELAEVLDRTEGWPAGVRLATMFLSRMGAERNLDGFGGTDRSVADYLVAEVLQRNPPDVQAFLLRTSVAELIGGDLADAIVPGGLGRSRLEALERANQFIVCVNPERTIYRYHPLLRDLLVYTLQRDDPEGFRAAHRAAAQWFVENHYPIRALEHAISAQDWDLAFGAFFEASPSVVGARRSELVEQLRRMPFEVLTPSAALELCAAGLEFALGRFLEMDGHLANVRRLLASGEDLPALGKAFLDNLECASGRARGDEASTASLADAALEHVSHAGPGPAADGLRAIATTQSAVGHLRAGDVQAARVRLASVVEATAGGDVALAVLGARGHVAWCDLVEGDLDAAIIGAQSVLDDATARGWTSQMQVAFACLALAMAQVLRGDAEAASRAVTLGLAANANGVEPWPTFALHLAEASVAVSRRRPRAAVSALTKARSIIGGRTVTTALSDPLTRVCAEVFVLAGHQPWPEVDPSTADVTSTLWSARARRALAAGDLETATRMAANVPRAGELGAIDDRVAAIEAAIVDAVVASRQRRMPTAVRALGEGLALATPQQIARPFIIDGSGLLAPLLIGASGAPHSRALVARILNAMGERSDARIGAAEPDPLAEPLTERELAILAELPTMQSNEEIARDFYVSINTVKSHLKHLYRKLGVANRRDAVRRARELGLIV